MSEMALADEQKLTRVVLEGVMGEKFGREWELCVRNAAQALRLINANSPGLTNWIRDNADLYTHYHVVYEREDGGMSELSGEELDISLSVKSIRFVPVIEGAGDFGRILIGAVLIVGALWSGGWTLTGMNALGSVAFGMGVSSVVGGVVGLLTKTPNTSGMDMQSEENKPSYYFNGPTGTSGEGYPISLIYGRVLVGSNNLHASVSVEQIGV